MLRKIFINMLIFSAMCFSGLSAFACDAELSANCKGFTFTGAGTHDWIYYGVTRFCVDYSVTLTNEAGTIITTKSGSEEYSPAGLVSKEDPLNFTITKFWDEEVCGNNFAVTGNIKFYFNCDRNDLSYLYYWGQSYGPITFDCCATAITLASFDAKPGNSQVELSGRPAMRLTTSASTSIALMRKMLSM